MTYPTREGLSSLSITWRELALMLASLALVVSLTACIGGEDVAEEEAAGTTVTETPTATEVEDEWLMVDVETESSGDIDQDLTDLDAMIDGTDPDADFDVTGLEEEELVN